MAEASSLRLVQFLAVAGVLASCGMAVAAEGSSTRPAIQVGASGAVAVPPEVRHPDALPVYAVLKVAEPPRIDGKLDDPAWQAARPLGRFFLDSGDGPMLYETIARIVRDDTYVYLAVDCRHPKIADVTVRKGTRDHVGWAGETVELFLDTDRSAADYVQVIFDMGGAFTDTYGGVPAWDGDITAATDVGGTGWRLEARLKIADLGAAGKVEKHLWGANVARSSGDDSASWARLLGSYQQPDHFGLLTFCEGDVAVEDLGLGVYAGADEAASSIPVRMTLRNLAAGPAEYIMTSLPVSRKEFAASRASARLPAAGSQALVASSPIQGIEAINVRICPAGDTRHALFETVLPVRHAKGTGDYVVASDLTCAVRPFSSVAISKEQVGAYLMAQSLQAEPLKRSGVLSLVSAKDAKAIWQSPVELRLPPMGAVCQRVDLPAERMKDGQYRLEWRLEGAGEPVVLRTEMVYSSLGLAGVRELLAGGGIQQVLPRLQCPLPKDAQDQAIVQVWIDRLTESLQRQIEQKDLDLSAKILRAYRMLMQMTANLHANEPYIARQRGWFETAFWSPVDNSAQPFSLFVPLDYDKHPDRKYPLVVYLHGRGGTHLGESGFVAGKDADVTDRLMMNVLARGRSTGYGPITADEVVREIGEVMARYRIDPDAVHIWGQSMGGHGTFWVASLYPDLFASARPYCGTSGGCPLEQMLNLPTFIHHGLADGTVPVHCSILAFQQMQRSGCPVQLYLHPQVGHDVTASAEKIARWETIKDIRRDPQPRAVVIRGSLPALAKAYWLSILRYKDIHQEARVRASFAGPNHLDIEADNIAWLKIALPCKWIEPKQPLQISDGTGHRWTEAIAADAKALYVNLAGPQIQATVAPPRELEDPTMYSGGGARCMFSAGQPIRIVYGTAGSTEETEALAKLAADSRRWNPLSRPLETGGYPILKDSEVDEQTLRTCDLIVLGTPKENALLARMAKKLPVKYADGKVSIEAEPAMSWAEGEVVLSLYYRNPLAPQRRIWWFAGQQDPKTLAGSSDITRSRCLGQPGPELIVQAKGSMRVVGTANVMEDWRLVRVGSGKYAEEVWQTPGDLDRQYNEALKAALPVDISLVTCFARSDMYDWQTLTAREVAGALPPGDLMIVPLTGQHLLDWHGKAAKIAQERGLTLDVPWAGVPVETIQPEAVYDVLVQPDALVMGTMEVAGIPLEKFRLVPAREVQAVRERFLRGKGLVGQDRAAAVAGKGT